MNFIKFLFLSLFLPMFVNAQPLLGGANRIATGVDGLITNIFVPLAFMLALLFFFWGVAKYIWSESNEDKGKGKQIMVWGVVALFVMSSIWGLVSFIRGELGVGEEDFSLIPTAQ